MRQRREAFSHLSEASAALAPRTLKGAVPLQHLSAIPVPSTLRRGGDTAGTEGRQHQPKGLSRDDAAATVMIMNTHKAPPLGPPRSDG